MKVALVNPPAMAEGYRDSSHMCVHLGLGYIASALQKEGIYVDVYECDLEGISMSRLIDSLVNEGYAAIGITSYYYNIVQVHRIARRVKRRKQVFVFVGGIYASLNYSDILNNKEIDCCCIGEGEITVPELIKAISVGQGMEHVLGISYRKDDEIIVNQPRECMKDINFLTFPQRRFFFKNAISSMIATRGCNGNCSFCGIIDYYTKMGLRQIRVRTPKNVVDEIEWLCRNKGIKYIYFQDENFLTTILVSNTWIEEFCNEIISRKISFNFYIYGRADDILTYKKEIQMLKEVGLHCIFVGIESFSTRQLLLYGKRTTKEINIAVLDFLNKLEMNIIIGFIIFDPYVSSEEIDVNIKNLIESKFYLNTFFGQTPISCLTPLYPMENTSVLKKLQLDGLFDEKKSYKYRFLNSEIELYYTFLLSWSKCVSKKYEEIEEHYKKIEYECFEQIENCRKRLSNLLKLDLEFIEITQPKNSLTDEEKSKVLDSYKKKISLL